MVNVRPSLSELTLVLVQSVVLFQEEDKTFIDHLLHNFADNRNESNWSVGGWVCGIFSYFVDGDDSGVFPVTRKLS